MRYQDFLRSLSQGASVSSCNNKLRNNVTGTTRTFKNEKLEKLSPGLEPMLSLEELKSGQESCDIADQIL